MLTTKTLIEVQNKKEMNLLLGKHSDVSVEKYVMRMVRESKKLRLQQKDKNKRNGLTNQERSMITKLKKEPEKNKTHWDNLLCEMKWMQSDFEKERRNKKKQAHNLVKMTKKSIETKHVELVKNIKRQEANLQKKYLFISRTVKNYWQKIEKLTKYNYNKQLNNEKIVQQQNRLMGFISRLEKISGKVASYLGPGVNKKINEQSSSLSFCSDVMNNNSTNLNSTQNELKEDEINITVKKNPDGTYSLVETNLDENLITAAQFAEQLQPKGTQLKEANISLQQPFLLNNILREYQLIGLHWLIALHDNHINGILADEMGLGKTIQTIALFAYLAANRGNWGPHLIIVPTTIIVNWEIEFKKWCPSFKILSYYGNQKERKAKRYGWHKPNSFHVCITSYKLVIQDYSIFKRKRWYYIVLDEAQNIKNFKSKRWQMLLNFKARRKLLLTGTPLQNDIMEIWSYLHFLMPNLFYSNEEFREWFHTQFYNAIHNNASLNKQIIQSLHSILRPFLLRRLKKDVEKQLPEKIEHVVYCELSRRQKYLYDEYINTDLTQDTLKRNDYFSIMNVLMQLRKVCNHPDLFDSRDYNTSLRSLFDIVYVFPYQAANLFEYNPMKTINYKNLKLYILEHENLNTWDYLNMIKYFPEVPLFQIFDEITSNNTQLYQPKYLIDENDILFKKNYADNSILSVSNSRNLKDNVIQMMINLSNPNTLKDNLKEGGQNKNNPDYKNSYNLHVPNYICPTNIPILQNNSLNNYFDMFYEIDTTEPIESQIYMKSVFGDYIKKIRQIKQRNKKQILHTYDLASRLDLVSSKPIFGYNGIKIMKISFFMDLVNSPLIKSHIIFSKNKRKNVVLSSVFNKGYKYLNSDSNIWREENSVSIYEGYDEEEREWEEEMRKRKEEEEKKRIEEEERRKKEEEERKIREEEERKIREEEEKKRKEEEEKKRKEEEQKRKEEEERKKIEEEKKKAETENNINKETQHEEIKIIPSEKQTQIAITLPENQQNNNEEIMKPNIIRIGIDDDDEEIKIEKPKPIKIKKYQQEKNQMELEYDKKQQNLLDQKETNQEMIMEIEKPKKPVSHISLVEDKFEQKQAFTSSDTIYHIHTKPLQDLIYTPQKFLSLCDDIMTYFRIYIPKVISCGPKFVLSKSSSYQTKKDKEYQILYNNLNKISNVVKYLSLFKTISCPDRKLVEYDSGKLIKLSGLLKKLYANKSKALIFTQMTRMLDILEIFLNIHGFTYVRLDGSTKVELRQQIVDKFNTDPKVFCFISSTRSGGIGLNLTGADSIIFFDTDWNPAMDKQAQDRCHRIGQTRTVNIYRLITLSTIEENIFKK